MGVSGVNDRIRRTAHLGCTGVLPKLGLLTLMSKGLTFCDRIMARGVGPGPLCIIGYGARSAGPDMDILPL